MLPACPALAQRTLFGLLHFCRRNWSLVRVAQHTGALQFSFTKGRDVFETQVRWAGGRCSSHRWGCLAWLADPMPFARTTTPRPQAEALNFVKTYHGPYEVRAGKARCLLFTGRGVAAVRVD